MSLKYEEFEWHLIVLATQKYLFELIFNKFIFAFVDALKS